MKLHRFFKQQGSAVRPDSGSIALGPRRSAFARCGVLRRCLSVLVILSLCFANPLARAQEAGRPPSAALPEVPVSEEGKRAISGGLKYLISTQQPNGGWRYSPRVGDADISVTVIQLCALRAAKNAGFDVPQTTIDQAVKYVHSCRDDRSGGFLYQPHSGSPGFARTAAAIYSLQVCGLYSDPVIPEASKSLFDNIGKEGGFATYGHFYAGPAMYMIGGKSWPAWYAKVSEQLLERKRTEGDRTWWERDGKDGESHMPVYYTAVNTTLLALPLGYLPLYQR